ncbi:Laminin subunit alpha-2 (Laminin M chain) (Laminin-12 subunit alpha) (Laminin-2 subunit alpha) (Laminin-4 subunit alpha) (Merosin heavy chain) [Durusdinium trenchii]|uniref:Laminin subunit alpha-2 (Laminin M chain) (Laminin-12 subunit alpha) (Laminin-2 subunit alpha) (Laminin-4 subunit alpha) (Merosin heavy chain) n=1 Tax=Durusdinium trenchii TaxID=1381693 RepID=A0ABP0IN70_9DINO
MEQQHEDTQLGRPVALEMRRASWAPPPCRSNETDGLAPCVVIGHGDALQHRREAAAAAAKFEEQLGKPSWPQDGSTYAEHELENERERGRAEAQQLQTQLAETDSALEAEKQEKQRIEGLLKETQLAKEELQSSSAAESRQAEADFASKVAVMQQQHEDAQREAAAAAAKLEEQRQELQQELQKSSEKVQLQETNLKDAYTRQFELEIAIQTADEEKQELTSNVDSLTAERRAIELERDELQDSCEHTKKELNEVLQSHRAAEADLQRQLAELREESGFLETWHQTKVLELEQKIEKLNAENAEKVTILEKERKAVEEERDALQQHLDLTQQELDQARVGEPPEIWAPASR